MWDKGDGDASTNVHIQHYNHIVFYLHSLQVQMAAQITSRTVQSRIPIDQPWSQYDGRSLSVYILKIWILNNWIFRIRISKIDKFLGEEPVPLEWIPFSARGCPHERFCLELPWQIVWTKTSIFFLTHSDSEAVK